MGTQAKITVMEKDVVDYDGVEALEEVACFCVNWDGWTEWFGERLISFLRGVTITESRPRTPIRFAALGAGCLAAQVVARFKINPGWLYMIHPDTDDDGFEYLYHVIVDHTNRQVVVETLERKGEEHEALFEVITKEVVSTDFRED